jgi:hypothetical protein
MVNEAGDSAVCGATLLGSCQGYAIRLLGLATIFDPRRVYTRIVGVESRRFYHPWRSQPTLGPTPLGSLAVGSMIALMALLLRARIR